MVKTRRALFISLSFALSLSHAPSRLAQGSPTKINGPTGGEAVRVRAPDEYPAAFERIMRGLASRYSLGFVLGEGEADDGRLHKLEVRINPRGERVKGKRLEVVARRGYYMPKGNS